MCGGGLDDGGNVGSNPETLYFHPPTCNAYDTFSLADAFGAPPNFKFPYKETRRPRTVRPVPLFTAHSNYRCQDNLGSPRPDPWRPPCGKLNSVSCFAPRLNKDNGTIVRHARQRALLPSPTHQRLGTRNEWFALQGGFVVGRMRVVAPL